MEGQLRSVFNFVEREQPHFDAGGAVTNTHQRRLAITASPPRWGKNVYTSGKEKVTQMIDNLKARRAFLAKFDGDAEALSAHMRKLAARRNRLIRMGQWLESLLLKEGFHSPEGELN